MQRTAQVFAAGLVGCAVVAGAQAPVRISKTKAAPMRAADLRHVVQKHTFVRGCENPQYAFDTAEVSSVTVQRKIDGRVYTLYPVHVHYHSLCQYADSTMNVEVDLRTEVHTDDFGGWVLLDPGFNESQNWELSMNRVRCRAQTVSVQQTDGSGKVVGTRPARDHGYIDCQVLPQNGD